MCNNNQSQLEIILGIVSPIGCEEKKTFFKLLEENFKRNGYKVDLINIINTIKPEPKDIKFKIPESLDTFIKMQVCNELRKKENKGILLLPALREIVNKRKNYKNKEKVVYLIDQLKNTTEYKALSHVYGLNYIQISLFSNYTKRNTFLEEKFRRKDGGLLSDITKGYLSEEDALTITCKNVKVKEIDVKLKDYIKEILPDTSSAIINKDFSDTNETFKESETGQEISKLFHKSHYFFNLDVADNELSNEIEKFVNLVQGQYSQYPTQDEFGMSLASVAKFRSNFPGKRQIGAAILSSTGEVISVASIRAPNPLANTAYEDEQKIQQGYQSLHDKIKNWEKFLSKIKEKENLCADCDLDKTDINELKQFIKDSLEYHPCTHAEISAILDAAKLGVSVRNATLYTTTFPCHLCAKDIITAGIKRVVYLAAYEKSKNKDLYPELISLDNAPSSNSAGVPFQSYVGIGPKRFSYVYDLDNKQQKDCEQEKLPPLLKFEIPQYYEKKEDDVIRYLQGDSTLSYLSDLLPKIDSKNR